MSQVHSAFDGAGYVKRGPLALDASQVSDTIAAELALIGIHFGADHRQQVKNLTAMALAAGAMDAAPDPQPTVYAGNVGAPIQFLQKWLPGFVRSVTQARKIDELVGQMTAGDWADEEVIQGSMELTGLAVPYGDYTNVPLASWNFGFDRRTIVRFEEGLRVGRLEEARSGKIGVSSGATKRSAAALALDIQRNRVGFYGYNAANNRTYGFLNDPALPAYVAVTGAAWTSATFLVMTAQIRTALAALRTQSGDTIDPNTAQITMAVASNRIDYLTTTTDFGISVKGWLNETYPNVRVVSAPELNGANGGANVFYLYADRATDDNGSDDGGQTMVQIVPSRFMLVGVEQQAKAYVEDYANATAGVLVKRPYLVVRYTGI
jgi:hypothetical protein